MRKVLYRVFMVQMLVCMSLVLVAVWTEQAESTSLPRLIATTFVLGLGAFLSWFTIVVWDIRMFLETD